MAKKKKPQSIYRTTWNSIKGQVDAKALEKFLKKPVYNLLVDKIESACGEPETSESDSEEN